MEGGAQVSRRKQRLIQQSAWHMPERGSELMEARCAAQNHLQPLGGFDAGLCEGIHQPVFSARIAACHAFATLGSYRTLA